MGLWKLKKSSLKGEITLPPSKSQTLRAILFGALGSGKSTIHHYLASADTDFMIKACRLFGTHCHIFPQHIEIEGVKGKIDHAEDVIYAGNSGIVLRFCSAVGGLSSHPVVITGDDSIRHQRPMKPLLEGLKQLGVSTASMRGDHFAPVIIQGPIRPGKAVVSGEDSQPISALLIAAAFAEGPIELSVRNPGEKPWVALTLSWFDRLGIPYESHAFEHYRLFGHGRYQGFEYAVPGDLSSAAFPIAAALITQSELTIKNIDLQDPQGDKALIHLFQKMGAHFDIDEPNRTLHVKKCNSLSGVAVDINDFIDALPILAVVACFAEGETHIQNASVARTKECDRIHCIASELGKMGADITETKEGLTIRRSTLKAAQLKSHNDHRMAMSLAVAALGAEGATTLFPVECISKTFPNFFIDFKRLGAEIEETG